MTEPTRADMKALLAEHGQEMRSDATMKVLRQTPQQGASVVVLDRTRKGELPPYCTHGYATCINCQLPCWMGHETEKILTSGEAFPLCMECAVTIIPADAKVVKNLKDNLRSDGPHS